jgi:predicted ATP-grasp superfamily ATP-dependent carboligase
MDAVGSQSISKIGLNSVKYDVCVTDCDTKHGFAIGRYLQRRGMKVLLIYRNKKNPFYYTIKNKNKYIIDLTQNRNIGKFISLLENKKPAVVIPVSNNAVKKLSEYRDRIDKITKTLLPENESLCIAQDKRRTFRYAEKLGIPCPRTLYETNDFSRLNNELDKLSFPVVIKFVNVGETGVRYCSNKKQVIDTLIKYSRKGDNPPIIQEFIEGVGVGFYAIYKDGKCQNYFMHRRIHEYPVTGGASSYAMSYFNTRLKEAGLRILDSLQWNGVAMVEFKLTVNDDLYLMEINPKFWGSYELAEKCGISFAYDYYKIAMGKNVKQVDYDKEIGFRWLFSDVMYYRDKILSGYENNNSFVKLKPKCVYTNYYIDEPLVMFLMFIDTIIRVLLKKMNPHSMP